MHLYSRVADWVALWFSSLFDPVAHGNFLVRGVVTSLTLAGLYGP